MLDLLFELWQFDPLFDRRQPLAMNDDPAVMPQPLLKGHEGDQRDNHQSQSARPTHASFSFAP
jgi:hypothetical protein